MFLIYIQTKNYVSNTILGLKYATLNETVWASKNLLMKARAREDNFNNAIMETKLSLGNREKKHLTLILLVKSG